MNELEVHGSGASETPSGIGGDQRGGRGLVLASLALGAFGLIVGITGIIIGNGASNEVAALREEMNSRGDPAEGLRSEIESINTRLGNVGGEVMRNTNNLRAMQENMRKAFQAVNAEVLANREQINRHTALLSSAAAPTAAPATVAAAPVAQPPGTGSGGPASAAPAGATREHTVLPGDNFTKIAARYGTTVPAIEALNPGVDSTKLQVGQKINIP